MRITPLIWPAVWAAILIANPAGHGQSPSQPTTQLPAATPSASPNPVAMATGLAAAADRRTMLKALGIADPFSLDPNDPKAQHTRTANYDEAKANPFPMHNPLRMTDGKPLPDADTWLKVQRPRLMEQLQTEIYGHIPAETPKVTWEAINGGTSAGPWVAESGAEVIDSSGTEAAIVTRAVGHVDNSAWPAASAEIDLTLYLPAHASGPVPVIVEDGPGGTLPGRVPGVPHPPVALTQILAKGWGCASVSTYTVQGDTGALLDNGVIGIVNKGKPRTPDQWGALEAWSWGLSRTIDYLETVKGVDAKRLGIEGHSRWGKAALLAAALEPRWSIVYASCSGEGGAKPSVRDWGETTDDLCGIGEYHWMAGNYLKYATHWDQLPVDSPELIAMVAPRPVFIGCGSEDRWADPHGQFLALKAAEPVWQLLGKKALGADSQPEPDVAKIDGDIGYRMHKGGHTDALDFPTFLTFAGKFWGN